MPAKKSMAKGKAQSGMSVRTRAISRRLSALEKHLGFTLKKIQKLNADTGGGSSDCW